ncbi:MAG: DUF4810 domain-containing protein [Bacteroidales bacterium]|nr:DUF4810 domain-containing protein [Bacteroidales bacterium]
MKKLLIFGFSLFLLASCTPQKQLYTWAKYEAASYNYVKNSDEESTQKLIENYTKIIEEQKGTRGIVPPGVCADYGFLLLQKGKAKEGKEMLMREIALYPESKIFIDRILKMIEE